MGSENDDESEALSAYALGEREPDEFARVAARLAADPAAAREVDQLRRMARALRSALAEEASAPAPTRHRVSPLVRWGLPLAAAATLAAAWLVGTHRLRPANGGSGAGVGPAPQIAAVRPAPAAANVGAFAPDLFPPGDPTLRVDYDLRALTAMPTIGARTMKVPLVTEVAYTRGGDQGRSTVIPVGETEVTVPAKIYYYAGDPGIAPLAANANSTPRVDPNFSAGADAGRSADADPDFTVYAVPQADAISRAELTPGVTIAIQPNGAFLFNGRPIREDQLFSELIQVQHFNPAQEVAITAADNARAAQISAAMDACRKAGLNHFSLKSR